MIFLCALWVYSIWSCLLGLQYISCKFEMSLESKIDKMCLKYKQLKSCQFPVVKQMIIAQLRTLAHDATELMNKNQHPSNTKRRRQIDDVLKKCDQIQQQLKQQTMKDVGGGGRGRNMNVKDMKQSDIARMAVHSVMFHQIRTSQLKIKAQEYEQIYNRMCKNQQVMKQIEMMVKQQGNDLDKVDQYLQSTYQNVETANTELNEAKEIQRQTRRMKFKLALSGFFGALGYKILGLPGMIMGLFTGAATR